MGPSRPKVDMQVKPLDPSSGIVTQLQMQFNPWVLLVGIVTQL
jgi:hypothetical protein